MTWQAPDCITTDLTQGVPVIQWCMYYNHLAEREAWIIGLFSVDTSHSILAPYRD